MMKIFFILLVALGITPVMFAQPTSKWTEADRDTLSKLVTDSKAKLVDATKGLSEGQLAFKPTDTSWSIKGVTEHLAGYAESYYWELMNITRTPLPQYVDSVRCTDAHFMALADNTDKHVASALFIPRDKYGSFQNTVKQYTVFSDALSSFIKDNKKNLREYFSLRPSKGVFDCRWRDAHQVVLVELAHVYRHLKQIERIKAHPGFPKG